MLFAITSFMQSLYIMSGLPFLFTIGVTTLSFLFTIGVKTELRTKLQRGVELSCLMKKVLQREKILQGDL